MKTIFHPKIVNDVPEITPEEFLEHMGQVTLIDVRQPDEFNGELAHIPGAQLVSLGSDLDAFLKVREKEEEIIFVCRSGARSGRATLQSRAAGFTNTLNLKGGMLLWNELKYPVERN